jgi:cell shape-determining protein MreC
VLEKVMSDETVPAGEQVLTSGGDGIFPKGLLVGRVTKVPRAVSFFSTFACVPRPISASWRKCWS